MYSLTSNPDFVREDNSGILIPLVSDNVDHIKYMEWIALGNTPNPAPPPPIYPVTTITLLQLRKALTRMGIRQQVETDIANSGNQDLIDGWAYITQVNRYDPFVLELATQLKKTSADIDALFTMAGAL